ncbi:MAG: hypothetical protein P8P74_00495 [Crocinitomicaceae bacterium]|nr:hypothetical protein [Crocinitomicaceae bacterium]
MEDVDLLVEALLEEFRIQYAATSKGHHRLNNKSVDRAHKIFTELRISNNVEKLLPFLKTGSPDLKANIAVYCLPIAEEECLSVLKDIRDSNSDSLLGVQAKYAIRNWIDKQYFLWDD